MSAEPVAAGTTSSSILANTAYRATADIGSKLVTFGLWIVMARRLGDADFGTFTFSLALVAVVTTPANFGQDRILTREVARDRHRLRDYFGNVVTLRLALAAPIVTATIAIGAFAGNDGHALAVYALLGVSIVVDYLVATCFASFQAFERLVFIPAVLVPQRALTALVGIAALLLGASVVVVAAVFAAASVFAFALALALLRQRVARPRFDVDPRRWTSLMRAAVPVGVAGVFGILLFRADMVMLRLFEPAPVVGDYGAAYRLFESTIFLSWSVGSAVYPVFSRLTADAAELRQVFERALKLLIALTVPLAVGAAVFAGPVIELLFGADYVEADNALRLLAPAIVLFPVSYLAGYLLVAQNRERVLAIVYVVVAVENVAANFVLLPLFSLDGAALGTSLSEALVAASLLLLAVRVTGPIDWLRVAAGPAFAGALEATVLLLLDAAPAAAIASAGLVYVVALAVVERVAFPGDARVVWSFLRRAG